jgi:hypothetical protein
MHLLSFSFFLFPLVIVLYRNLLSIHQCFKMEQHHQLQGHDMNEFLRQIAVAAYVQQQQQLSQQGATPPPAYNSPEMASSHIAAASPITTPTQASAAVSSFWSPRQPKANKKKATAASRTVSIKQAKVPARVVAKPSASNPRGREGQSVGDFRCVIM